jgi:hypothetical protein
LIRAALRSRALHVAAAMLIATGAHLWLWGQTDLTSTVSLIELEWTLVAIVGTVYSLDFLRECHLNWRALNGDEAEQLTVERDILIGGFMLGAHLFLLSLGVLGLISPNHQQSMDPDEARALGSGLTMLGEGLVALLFAIRRKGTRIRRLLTSNSR